MAGRVNTKFIVTLSVGLLGAFALMAGAGFFLLKNSSKDLARVGDTKMAAKQYDKAVEYYSKAVNKEQTNATYLEKWREALRSLAPDTVVQYREYFDQWRAATRQLARVKKDDVDGQRKYLDLIQGTISPFDFSRADQDRMIQESEALISLHSGEATGGKWETLKRYRGTAKLEIVTYVKDAKPELAKESETDLAAALNADPADADCALAIEQLYLVRALRANEKSLQDQAKEFEDKAAAVVTAFLEKNPNDPTMQLNKMRRDLVVLQREMAKKRTATNIAELALNIQQQLKPQLESAMANIRAMDPAKITVRLIDSLRGMEQYLDSTGKLPRTQEAIDLVLAKRPGDSGFLAARADLLASRDDFAGASDAVQKILDLPIPPTSLEGLRLFQMRNNAQYLQALWKARLAGAAPAADKSAALASAKLTREKLVAIEAPNSPNVMFVDAQLAFTEGDFGKANRLLDQYTKATRNRPNPDALLLQAQVAEKLDQLGLAKEKLDLLLKLAPTKVAALFYLADVETRLQNNERALQIYQGLLELSPDNKDVRNRVDILTALSSKGGTSVDPVMAVLIQIRDMTEPKQGEKDRTAEVLPFLKAKTEELKYDPRLVSYLVGAYLKDNKRDEAIAVVKKGRELWPESTELKDLEIGVNNPDPMGSQIELINSREGMPLEKLLGKYLVYRRFAKKAEADAQLAEAVKTFPDDKRVVEYEFLDAMEDGNWELAQQLTDKATKGNMDDADGLTYKARLLASQGKTMEAITAIDEAVAKGGALPEVWRLKGRMERVAGRGAEAAVSFREAAKLRPSDIGAINDLLGALKSVGRDEEALAFARDSEKYGRGDEMFLSTWLNLEAAVGNKALAIEKRENMAKNAPDLRNNLIALAGLYVDEREWAKARPLIDQVRAKQDGLDAIALDAAWNWEQGEHEKARAVFSDYISKIEKSKLTTYPFMVYAQFLVQRSDLDGALTVLEQAREVQDPKTVEADKAIAEVHMKAGAYDAAAAVCRRIVNANADSWDHLFRKRLIECMIKLRNYDVAQKEIDDFTKGTEPDAMSMLLISDVKDGLKDKRGQKDILDRAVAKYPSEPMVFLKRGQAALGDPKTAKDAIGDFNKALQLRPEMWQAYRMRAAANITLGQTDEAIKDLRAAIKISPFNDELLFGLLADLMRMGRPSDAMDIATEVIAKRDRDVGAMTTIGSIMAQSNAFPEAARFYSMAFKLDKQDSIAQRYLDALLTATPPNTAEAKKVLDELGEQRVRGNPGFLMATAKYAMNTKNPRGANAAAGEALRLLKIDEPTMMLAWYNDLRKLITSKESLLKYLDDTRKLANAKQSQEWLDYFTINTNLSDPATMQSALVDAKAMMGNAKEPSINQLLFRSVSSAVYAAGDFAEAARIMREGLGQFPNDVEMLNNLAYNLAVNLNKPDDAVPLAEHAATLTPAVADVQDTLGMVYFKANRCKESCEVYRRALLLASTPLATLKISTHLIDALLCAENKVEARAVLKDAQKVISNNEKVVLEGSAKSAWENAAKEFDAVAKKVPAS